MDFAAFAFRGHAERRRVISFGRAYDFECVNGADNLYPSAGYHGLTVGCCRKTDCGMTLPRNGGHLG